MSGLRTLVALELQALWTRRLWRWGMAVAFVLAAAGAWLAGRPDPEALVLSVNGWNSLAGGLGPALLFAGLASMLLGSQLIAAEAGEGSLRAVLLRPVGRPAVIASKLAALGAGVVGLALASFLGGATVAGATYGFGDVTVEVLGSTMVKQSAGTMALRGLWLVLALPLALYVAGAIGLAVSAVTESGGAAVTGTLFAGVPLAMASTLTFGWTEWLFPRPCLKLFDAYATLAGGYDTAGWQTAPLGWSIGCSVGWLLVVTAAASVAFQRRDVLA